MAVCLNPKHHVPHTRQWRRLGGWGNPLRSSESQSVSGSALDLPSLAGLQWQDNQGKNPATHGTGTVYVFCSRFSVWKDVDWWLVDNRDVLKHVVSRHVETYWQFFRTVPYCSIVVPVVSNCVAHGRSTGDSWTSTASPLCWHLGALGCWGLSI